MIQRTILRNWCTCLSFSTLRWRHNERDCVSNHQPHYCLLERLFGRRSKKTSKLRVTGLCEGNSPETGEFPAQRASNAENVSIWWRHHELRLFPDDIFECVFLNENVWISIKISLKFVPNGPMNNIPALVQIMAWCRPGDKPLFEPMMVRLLTHILVTRPQWVNKIHVI